MNPQSLSPPHLTNRRTALQVIAASVLLPTMSSAEAQMAVSTAINRVARYRALSQRIAKAYVQLQIGVLPDQADKILTMTRKQVRQGFVELNSVPWPAELAQQLTDVQKSFDTLEAVLVMPPTAQSVAAAVAQADRMFSRADTATEAFEKSTGMVTAKLVNTAGRQRALSQRLAKNYLLVATGIDLKAAREQLTSDTAAFSKAMTTLEGSPLTTPAIRDQLALGNGQWVFFSSTLLRKADARGMADVATTSERLLEVTDRLTDLYDAALKQVLG